MEKMIMLATILLLLLLHGCNPTEPNNNSNLGLALEDVSCTEAWLKIGNAKGSLITLKRDEKEIMQFKLTGTDTVVLDNSLLPNKAYYYEALVNNNEILSNKISVTTMDTTSHDFTWQTFIIGNPLGGSSYFRDVAILSEDDIWVAGRYFIKDSLQMFNAIHWNGSDWEYKRVIDTDDLILHDIRDIYPVRKDNIWLTDGGIHNWDGVSYKTKKSFDRISLIGGTENWQSVNKLFYFDVNNIYGVGNKGMITSYDGKQWNKIESGTEMDIQDVWGITDKNTGEETILCVASNTSTGTESKVIGIKNENSFEISNEGLPWSTSSVWFNNPYSAYIAGDGIFKATLTDKQIFWENINKGISTYYLHNIRGQAANDIFLSGAGGVIVHYNGYSWKNYLGNGLQNFYGNLHSIQVKGNTVCAVGEISANGVQAIIILGKRN